MRTRGVSLAERREEGHLLHSGWFVSTPEPQPPRRPLPLPRTKGPHPPFPPFPRTSYVLSFRRSSLLVCGGKDGLEVSFDTRTWGWAKRGSTTTKWKDEGTGPPFPSFLSSSVEREESGDLPVGSQESDTAPGGLGSRYDVCAQDTRGTFLPTPLQRHLTTGYPEVKEG